MAKPDKTSTRFKLVSKMEPRGDQPKAIQELLAGIERKEPAQVLLGITGSGKTFTIANVIQAINRPTLFIAHNKTLAAQPYASMTLTLEKGEELRREVVLRKLVEMQYERNDVDFHRGTFRVRGDTVEVFPAYEQETALRIEWWGDEIESISEVDPLRGKVK